MTRYVIISLVVLVALVVGTALQYTPKKEEPRPTIPAKEAREPGDCTYSRPCTLTVRQDGSTDTIPVKPGYRVCFDPPVGANLEGFGYRITSDGREYVFNCTPDELGQQKCKLPPPDSFRFVPKPGVTPPRYWFTNDPGIFC